MNIIFGYVSYWQVPILRVLKYLKLSVFYLNINAKTDIKKNAIATKLKKNNIYPLPLEFEKEISPKSDFSRRDPEEFAYKKNLKLVPNTIIEKYCDLFSVDNREIIKLRLLIQDYIVEQHAKVGRMLATWAALYPLKKIIYISFNFKCSYNPDLQRNVSKIIIPIDLLVYLIKTIKKIFLTFFNFKKRINADQKTKSLNGKSFKDFENKNVAFVVHKGLIYGSKDHILYEKSLYYSNDKNSCLNKYNILHLDYENYLSSDQNLHWVCLRRIKISNYKIFYKTFLAAIKKLYLIKNWSKFLGWILCMQQYNSYLKYCEVIKRFKSLKLALIDYEILCPKTLILALEKNNIKTVATQERFITTFTDYFDNTVLDTYYAASEYVADYIKKSKFQSIKKIIPVGQYRGDYILSYKKKNIPKEISEVKERGKKIIIALGYSVNHWFESNIEPIINWSAQICFLEDMIKISKCLSNTFIVLRYKNINWLGDSHFKEVLNKLENSENIIISTNYKESLLAYKLCANADLVIAKHTSIADECLANQIPVLFHEYSHNAKKSVSEVFDYSSSVLMCYDFEELLEKSKSLLFNNSSDLKNEIQELNKKFYYVNEKKNVKKKILDDLEELINLK